MELLLSNYDSDENTDNKTNEISIENKKIFDQNSNSVDCNTKKRKAALFPPLFLDGILCLTLSYIYFNIYRKERRC